MSVNEILMEMGKLSPDYLKIIQEKLDQLHNGAGIEETPEMLEAIDEGLRSSEEGKNITIEELQEKMKSWNSSHLNPSSRTGLGENRAVHCPKRCGHCLRFCDELVSKAQSLRNFPQRHGKLIRRSNIRKLPYGNYLIFYKIYEDTGIVEILRFWHSAREQNRLRLKEEPAAYALAASTSS